VPAQPLQKQPENKMQSSYFQTKKTNKRSHWDDAGYEEPVDKKQKKDKKQDYEKQRKQKRGEE
jgi:hypothetical protein